MNKGPRYWYEATGLILKKAEAAKEVMQRIPGQGRELFLIKTGEGLQPTCSVLFYPANDKPADCAEMVREVMRWLNGHSDLFEPFPPPNCKECKQQDGQDQPMRPAGTVYVCESCGSVTEPDDDDQGGDPDGDRAGPTGTPPDTLGAAAEVPAS